VLQRQGATLAVAESLTGGSLAARITDVAGASTVFRGGVVAYAGDVKATLLDVPVELLDRHGAVSAEVAEAMAVGARRRFCASYAVSTTGVAGPGSQEGKAAGSVYVGCAGPVGVVSQQLTLTGSRADIRASTCIAALDLLRRTLEARGTPQHS
jgi:nicotinamide-nucleotide amidase